MHSAYEIPSPVAIVLSGNAEEGGVEDIVCRGATCMMFAIVANN